MKQTKLIMDMPITVEVLDQKSTEGAISKIFDYFTYIDNKFSTFKDTSEITRINNGRLPKDKYSQDMKIVLSLCEKTKQESNGFFDINKNGRLDPSGLVKGWAILNAVDLLKKMGFNIFYVDAGGDIQVSGKKWKVGIRNPKNRDEVVKVLEIENQGIATSGTYIRGQHIYNPKNPNVKIRDIISLTIIGPNVYEADRFATAAFAMGKEGIKFIEKLKGFEGYMINNKNIATFTSGFDKYVKNY